MKKCYLALLYILSLLWVVDLDAQSHSDGTIGSVTGTTISEKGDILAGVTVKARNENSKAELVVTSDEQGIFSFSSLSLGDHYTFTFTFVGYETYVIKGFLIRAGRKNNLLVKLKESAGELSQVVVIGYGTQAKKDVTGAVGVLHQQDIKDAPVTNFDQAMAGKLAGVEVLQTTGEPGKPLTFRIRGTTSITAGTSPLIVLDGIPLDDQEQSSGAMSPNPFVTNGSTTSSVSTTVQPLGSVPSNPALEAVNPADIASIEVLKDASAAAIYGSRGANGVVLITTRHGSAGRMNVNYTGVTGVGQVTKKIPMLNAYQYAALSHDGHNNAYLEVDPAGSVNDPDSIRPIGYERTPPQLYPYLAGTPGLTNTNWQDQIFRTAPFTNQTLSISGGRDKLTYFISGNYTDQEGIIINSGYKRYSTRLNLDAQSGKLRVGLNFSPSFSVEKVVQAYGPYSSQSVIGSALQMSPTWPVYNPNGSYNYQGNGFWRIGTDYQQNEVLNPVALANLINDKVYHANLLGKVFLEYELLKGLKYTISLGGTLNDFHEDYYRPSTLPLLGLTYYTAPSNPTAINSSNLMHDWLVEQTMAYKLERGDHQLTLLAGYTAQRGHGEYNSVTATNFPNDLVQTINAGQVINGTAYVNDWSLLSALARAQYAYKDRYLLSASFRSDGSSRFGSDNKWGDFPSVSAGWRISQERFMEKLGWLSNLKLRVSYGLTGNFQIGNYAPVALVGSSNYILGTSGGQLASGEAPTSVANPNLGWEKTAMLDGGIEAGFFKGRLTFEADWYNSNTSHLLLNVPVPVTTGFGTATENLGKVNNQGFELTVGTQNHIGAVSWRISANIATNRNMVKALGPGNAPIIATNGTTNTYFITEVGKPIGSYYLLKENGVFANAAQLKTNPHFSSTAPGDFRFVDINGDDSLDVNGDRTILGKYFPSYTFGFSSSFEWKHLDLAFSIQGSEGSQVINLMRRYIDNMEGNFNNMIDALHRWESPDNPGDGKTPRANRKATGNNETPSSWIVENGSYVRLQNVTIGYTLPPRLLARAHLRSLRLYLAGQNLVTLTHYSGYNPEVNLYNNNALTPGLDYGAYPVARTYAAGVNLGF
jgi:TonB-linked SusC/RagA family outer membrane protein